MDLEHDEMSNSLAYLYLMAHPNVLRLDALYDPENQHTTLMAFMKNNIQVHVCIPDYVLHMCRDNAISDSLSLLRDAIHEGFYPL